MIMGIYVIYDKIARQVEQIFLSNNIDSAQRGFRNSITKLDANIQGDYALLDIGEINMETGEIQHGLDNISEGVRDITLDLGDMSDDMSVIEVLKNG